MQNKLITLTAAAAAAGMAGRAAAIDFASNAGQITKTVFETTTSTASICPASAAGVGLPETTVTSTIVLSTTVEGKDCGPTPIVTETKTVTATSESPSSQLSSNEVGATDGGVVGASAVSTSTSTVTSINTVTSTSTAYYSVPANSSSILGTGTGALPSGALPSSPSGTGFSYPSGAVPYTGGAVAIGMSSIVALGAVAAGALYLF